MEKKKPSFISTWPAGIRILAVILAVLLVGEIILSSLASVKFSSASFSGTDYAEAAEIIENSDSYLTSGTLSRMRSVVSMLGEPKTADQYSLFASVAIADEDYERAIKYFIPCIDMFEGSDEELSQMYVKLGCLQSLTDNWEDAIVSFEKGIELNGSNADGHLMICQACLNNGNYEKALDSLKKYSSLSELSDDQFDALISLELNLEKYDDALKSCQDALNKGLHEKSLVEMYAAQSSLLLGDTKSAIKYAQAGIEDGADVSAANNIMILSYQAEGNLDKAYVLAMDQVNSGTESLDAYDLAAQCAYSKGDYDVLLVIAERALENGGSDESLVVFKKWLGIASVQLSDYETAIESLSAYLNYDSSIAEIYYLRGLSYMGSGMYKEASDDFTSALISDELYDECLYNRGLCLLKLSQNEQAAKDFEEVIIRNEDQDVIKLVCELLSIDDESLEIIRQNAENGQ